MKISSIAAFAFTLALAGLGVAAADPDPQALALATRYVAATGGSYELFEEQAYAAAKTVHDPAQAVEWQQALQQATADHRRELADVDARVSALMAQTFSPAELDAAVAFYESPLGREIAAKKAAYFAAPFAVDRAALTYTPQETAALTAYEGRPEARSMAAKTPALQPQMLALMTPVMKAIQRSAWKGYCHASRHCTSGGDDYDQLAGPTIREP